MAVTLTRRFLLADLYLILRQLQSNTELNDGSSLHTTSSACSFRIRISHDMNSHERTPHNDVLLYFLCLSLSENTSL